MGIKKGGLIELEITGMAFGGKGLAKVDGLAVFVEKQFLLTGLKPA